MLNTEIGVFVAVISSGRPQNVSRMQSILGDEVTWFVGNNEGGLYQDAGACCVIESGGLIQSRNVALSSAWDIRVPCVQVSDDLLRIKCVRTRLHPTQIAFIETIGIILAAMNDTSAKLGGVSPTANPLNYDFHCPVRTSHFIVGDLIVVKPCALWFDSNLTLKEDYDYTLQHLATIGGVARCDRVLAEFQHRTNAGGAVGYRTAQREQQTISYLKRKWGAVIADNPRRENEILLKWKSFSHIL